MLLLASTIALAVVQQLPPRADAGMKRGILPADAIISGSEVPQLFLELAVAARAAPAKGGVALAAIAPSSAMWLAGLRPGDRVVAVSGRRLSCADDVVDAWASVRSSVQISVSLVRGGAAQTLVVSTIPGGPAVNSLSAPPTLEGLTRLDDTHFRLSQAACDALQPLERLASQARILPVFERQPMGFKLFSIVSGSTVEQLGLRNGDTVTALNDVPLTSAEQSKAALAAVKGRSHSWLDVNRGGASLRLDYVVEDRDAVSPKRSP